MILAVRVCLPNGLALRVVPRALHVDEALETQVGRKPDRGEQWSDLAVKPFPTPASFRREVNRQEQSRLLRRQTPCRPLEVSSAIKAQPTQVTSSSLEDCGPTAQQVL